jgi:recombinational DNA repair ATPase RecF
MQILGFVAENYKKLRIVEITPKGRIVQITGKNGQGKTSVLDAIWSALVGAKAIPEKPVRKGADKARIKIDLGELIVRRDISTTGAG